MNAHLIPAAGDLKGRSVEEWIGKDADTLPPPRVRRRVLLRFARICYWSGTAIRPGDSWDLDHKIALVNGGENRESNLAPIRHGRAHQDKTQRDLDEAVLVRRMGDKHFGLIPKPRNPIPGSKASGWKKRMDGTVERREQ